MTTDLFTAVRLRDDVESGELSDAIFAASLQEVVAGTAPATYGDPAVFFPATHPTGGLKVLLVQALGRLGGGKPDAPPVIRLETNLISAAARPTTFSPCTTRPAGGWTLRWPRGSSTRT